MANCNYGDSEWDLLVKILNSEAAILAAVIANGGAGGGGASNITGINSIAPSVGCGTSDAGTLRVAPATDCTAPVSVTNGAGAAAVNIQDGGNSITIDGTITATPSGVQDVQGNVAHDAVDSGNPVKIGARAIAHGTNPTAVAAGDRTDVYANRAGVPFVIGGHPNIIALQAAYVTAQGDVAIITVGAGSKIVVTAIAAVIDNATTVDVGVRIGFGAATTPTTTGVILSHPGIAPGSGFSRGDGSGILGIGADGEDLRISSEVPTTGSLAVLVTYYTIES